jgi:hypothetical protein
MSRYVQIVPTLRASSLEAPERDDARPAEELLPLAVREVLGLPVRYLLALPLASTLLVVTHEGERCALRSSSTSPSVEGAVLAFVGPELLALALAVEHGRACGATLVGWLRKKAQKSTWRLTSAEALGGLSVRPSETQLTVERLLGALAARLVEVRT